MIFKIPSSSTASIVNPKNNRYRLLFSDSNNNESLSIIDKDDNILDLEGASSPTVDYLNDIGDVTTTTSHGNIIYRNDTGWVNLEPGTSGQLLTTNGAGENPTWENKVIPDGNGIFDIISGTVPSNFSMILADNIDINSVLFIDNNVGIGTNTPTHLLTVGTSSNGGEIAMVNASGSTVIKTNSITDNWSMNLPINSGNVDGEMLLNDGNGNLYFGTTPSIYLPTGKVMVGTIEDYSVARSLHGDITNDYLGNTIIGSNSVSYDKMQIMTTKSILGSTGGGAITEIPILDAYILLGTVSTYLENPSNWNGGPSDFDYSGPTISNTYQGQQHFYTNYFFLAVDDDIWIRMSMV